MASQERFGYEWDRYFEIDPNYEGQFRNWIFPLTGKDFFAKRVLDVGCGMGRNAYYALRLGAASVLAIDYDGRSVARAKENLKGYPTAEVAFGSAFELGHKDEFDIAFSIGVVHHLEDPKLALRNMVAALRSGGTLLIWVYSYEGNEWIVRFVDPVRKGITSQLPPGLVHALSYLCSIPLWIFVKAFRGPSEYLKQLSTFDLRHVHSIVFDQLIPTIAHYWKKDEVVALVESLPLENIDVHHPPNGMGWVLIAQKR